MVVCNFLSIQVKSTEVLSLDWRESFSFHIPLFHPSWFFSPLKRFSYSLPLFICPFLRHQLFSAWPFLLTMSLPSRFLWKEKKIHECPSLSFSVYTSLTALLAPLFFFFSSSSPPSKDRLLNCFPSLTYVFLVFLFSDSQLVFDSCYIALCSFWLSHGLLLLFFFLSRQSHPLLFHSLILSSSFPSHFDSDSFILLYSHHSFRHFAFKALSISTRIWI